jgi:magnesium transporter
VDVIQEEATEDIQKMAAVSPNEKPYLKQSVFSIWKARVPWLLLLMISATFTSMILSEYEAKLIAISSGVLYAFVPMLMGTAGNAGNQTSVTIIRALALGDVNFKDVFRVILKELAVAFLIGVTVAAACFLKLYFIDNLYNEITLEIAVIVSVVLLVAIMMAKLVGCLLPLLAKKCKLDPAVVASPFMTTIVDVLSLIIYCSVTIAIL